MTLEDGEVSFTDGDYDSLGDGPIEDDGTDLASTSNVQLRNSRDRRPRTGTMGP